MIEAEWPGHQIVRFQPLQQEFLSFDYGISRNSTTEVTDKNIWHEIHYIAQADQANPAIFTKVDLSVESLKWSSIISQLFTIPLPSPFYVGAHWHIYLTKPFRGSIKYRHLGMRSKTNKEKKGYTDGYPREYVHTYIAV